MSEVVLLGRRGPEHAAFTNPELRELGEMTGVDVQVDPAELEDLIVGELFGLSRDHAPATFADFRDYMRERIASRDLHVTDEARELGRADVDPISDAPELDDDVVEPDVGHRPAQAADQRALASRGSAWSP